MCLFYSVCGYFTQFVSIFTQVVWAKHASACLATDPIIKKHNDFYVFCKEKSDAKYFKKDFIRGKYDKLSLDFDSLILHFKKAKLIRLNSGNWTDSSCSCPYFSKCYMCYHIVVIAVNEQLAKIPNEYNTNPIAQKPKSGRKSNAAKALVAQQK